MTPSAASRLRTARRSRVAIPTDPKATQSPALEEVASGPLRFGPMPSDDRSLDRSSIEAVVADLASAWENADGTAWGGCFTDDADFTTWFGLRMTGRDAISTGHQEIFATFYAGTVYDLEVEFVRFLDDDIAVAGLAGSVYERGGAAPSTPQTVPLAVMVRGRDGWKVAAFQNTHAGELDMRRHHGDVRRS